MNYSKFPFMLSVTSETLSLNFLKVHQFKCRGTTLTETAVLIMLPSNAMLMLPNFFFVLLIPCLGKWCSSLRCLPGQGFCIQFKCIFISRKLFSSDSGFFFTQYKHKEHNLLVLCLCWLLSFRLIYLLRKYFLFSFNKIS